MSKFLTRARLLTILYAAAGVAAFKILGLPLPFLFGPMAACLIAALLGARMQGMGEVGVGARTILGVAVGASITPAVAAALPAMALSLALMPLYIALIGLIGVPFFRYFCKLDPVTSFYAAMPGGLQDMIIFGQEAGGDVRTLSLIHATRVLVIVTIAPILLTTLYGVSLDNPIGRPMAEVPWHELVLLALAALVGWKLFERLNLFGASIIGPLVVTAILSLTDLVHTRPPAEAIVVAQFFIGLGIGVSYVGVTLNELRRTVLYGVAFVLVLAALAAVFTEIAVLSGLAAPLEAFLAFAPGGQAEMTVLAIIAGADLGFVVTHHLTRLILVITLAPIAARLAGARKKTGPD
ncbi:AbrB family transcriptional regulator [Polymorphum gilvum]|uniref:Putative ammonia monooxygenase superfamily n=1 Tax=Polymorphum gilvum (strain LMG 25793 / CGMCC 1.9160 / SL003B-26A1) TaxID=991905 RepID=F2J3Z7_POLGS|nr:AbrB family transcriptional regulator [Polymorphum gilvum]ADZ68979.1 Putative ammonia monooxygenase superfamily [Polymorphum gilvum SL003B-26A1]